MKKILIFSLAYYPRFVSGAEAAIKEITDRVAPEDIEFHLVTARLDASDPRDEKVGAVHVHRVGWGTAYISKILFVPLAALKARSLHREIRFDAMWGMMTYMLFPVVLARVIGVHMPYVLTLQDGDPYEKVFERWFIRPVVPLLDYGFRHATVVQAISRHLAEWPLRRGSRVPVALIYNGANPRDFRDDVDEAVVESLKQRLGKQAGDIWLVNTSRLVHQKGFDTIIRALPLLPANIKLLAVGSGADEAMLKQLASDLGVDDRVMFTGQVSRDEVTLYRRTADIFVAPSRSEGLGNAFISAMASRLPLITSGVGGISDYAIDGKTAWVVPPDDPEAIARAVEDVLAYPEKAKEIVERARRMVEEKYDWDRIATEMRVHVFAAALRSPLVGCADALAAEAHAGQERKTGGAYVEHPRAVARILEDAGCDEVTVAAGLLHDVLEDTKVSPERIRECCGEEVLAIVRTVTEDKALPWEERKAAYVESVRRGSEAAKLVSLADKIHNAESLIEAHAAHGPAVWARFNRNKEKKLAFEKAMLAVFRETLQHALVNRYASALDTLETLPA